MNTALERLSSSQLLNLQQRLLDILRQQPTGLGEYELLKQLQKEQHIGFPRTSLTNNLALFRMHFLLFHLLYRLRDQLWEEHSGYLHITPLQIQLQLYQSGSAALCGHDALRDYYLDITPLYETTEDEVKERLQWFWKKFAAGEERQQALQTLALSEPVDYAAIKRRYRELAAQHHPDRGGDTAEFQAINHAMGVLERYYS